VICLLVHHVPFAPARSAASFRLPETALLDLRAQARALAERGGRLIVAAPLLSRSASPRNGESGLINFVPDAEGFEYAPLPHYDSLRGYWSTRREIAQTLANVLSTADLVQFGAGGHPILLAENAWDLAAEANRPRVFSFDTTDPVPGWTAQARAAGNPLRRAGRARYTRRKIAFCRRAVREADLVFAHNQSVIHRFREAWDDSRCHAFLAQPFLEDGIALSPTELEDALRARSDKRKALRVLCVVQAARGDQAIRALAHCRRLSVPIDLTLVADTQALSGLQEMINGLAMDRHVRTIDSAVWRATTRDLTQKNDVLLVVDAPESGETEARRHVLWAMAQGLAVVSYENPATDRLIEADNGGRVVSAGNVLLLAQALIDLQQNRRTLIELTESGWRLANSATLSGVHRRRAELMGQLVARVNA
jgi:hypothetical protein